LGARDGRGAKIRRFSAPDWPHGRQSHVGVCRYRWSLVGGNMTWIIFGVGAALGVGIGVAIGASIAALIIGWWDRDAERTVRRRNF
jgi:membrane associated rhomboid family serine protease